MEVLKKGWGNIKEFDVLICHARQIGCAELYHQSFSEV